MRRSLVSGALLVLTRRLLVGVLLLMTPLAAPAIAQDGNDAVAFIVAIYQSYKTDRPGVEQMYSQRLQALINKDASETPEGMVGRIDWDVIVDGQDWRISKLDIQIVSQTNDTALVRATFDNFDAPRNLLFDLVREDGHWRIDDIQETLKPRWTMSKILSDAPDAQPDSDPGQGDKASPGANTIELR